MTVTNEHVTQTQLPSGPHEFGKGAALEVLAQPRVPAVHHVIVRQPNYGLKGWVLETAGLYVLERGPGLLQAVAITRAGGGSLEIMDGIPDEQGMFRTEVTDLNGRAMFLASPVVVGPWPLGLGFHYGLAVRARGASCVATISWRPFNAG